MPQIIELLLLIVCLGILLSAVSASFDKMRSKKRTSDSLIQEAEKIREQLAMHRTSLEAKRESLSMKKQGVDLLQEEIRVTEELDRVSKELRNVEKELGCIDPDNSGSPQTETGMSETTSKTFEEGR